MRHNYQLYLLDDAQHSALLARNARIAFTLSTGTPNSAERLNITLPHAAFDLQASPPLAGNQTYCYFPLKQAANETQHTLGRTILLEVYILADFDRGVVRLCTPCRRCQPTSSHFAHRIPPLASALLHSLNQSNSPLALLWESPGQTSNETCGLGRRTVHYELYGLPG